LRAGVLPLLLVQLCGAALVIEHPMNPSAENMCVLPSNRARMGPCLLNDRLLKNAAQSAPVGSPRAGHPYGVHVDVNDVTCRFFATVLRTKKERGRQRMVKVAVSSYFPGRSTKVKPLAVIRTGELNHSLRSVGDLGQSDSAVLLGRTITRFDESHCVQVVFAANLGRFVGFQRTQKLRHRTGECVGEPDLAPPWLEPIARLPHGGEV